MIAILSTQRTPQPAHTPLLTHECAQRRHPEQPHSGERRLLQPGAGGRALLIVVGGDLGNQSIADAQVVVTFLLPVGRPLTSVV